MCHRRYATILAGSWTYDLTVSKLFRFQDRKEVPLLLSPTHEEEITSLVARTLKSYKELPLRLYQISKFQLSIP